MAEVTEEPSLRNRIQVFQDRRHAGLILAEKMTEYSEADDTIVLAIPAGGVAVAHPLAQRLRLPLDVAVTRKLHVPWDPEAGFGAVSWDGQVFLNEPLAREIALTHEEVQRSVAEETAAIRRRLQLFRGDKPPPDLRGKTAIIVDDGLASGYSMLTTLKALKPHGVRETVVAVPTAPARSIQLIRPHADRIICLNVRTGRFFAVADAYRHWYDLTDEEVVGILRRT